MAFLRKEFLAILKTYRIWVIPLIFLLFALMSPPIAKFAPEVAKSTLPKGVVFNLPTPTILDSFGQYFKNLAQIGILAIILLSMGLVSEEKSKGTLQLVVTKPVSRTTVVIAKFLAQSILILSSMVIAALICYLYSIAFFKDGSLTQFAQANLLFIVYYLLIMAITIFFSTILRNQIAAGGLTILALAILSILPSLHNFLDKYSPAALLGLPGKIVSGQALFSQATWPLIISLILVALLLCLGIIIFNRQEL